jgi:hypothetical protein
MLNLLCLEHQFDMQSGNANFGLHISELELALPGHNHSMMLNLASAGLLALHIGTDL